MGKLTKAGFAASKKSLGLKGKLTRKQVQRVFKHAIKKLGRSRSKSKRTKTTTRKKSNPKRRITNLARRKKRRSGKSITRTAFKFIRIGALAAPGLIRASSQTEPSKMLQAGFGCYGGFNLDGNFDWGLLTKTWSPYLATCLATYGIPKLVGIIRKL